MVAVTVEGWILCWMRWRTVGGSFSSAHEEA